MPKMFKQDGVIRRRGKIAKAPGDDEEEVGDEEDVSGFCTIPALRISPGRYQTIYRAPRE